MPQGELKHGPIALIDENVPVIVIAPHDELYEKTISNMKRWRRAAARSFCSRTIAGWRITATRPSRRSACPRPHAFISPLLYAVPMQLLAYHAAVFMGTDVDQPRNLAKSVTVE